MRGHFQLALSVKRPGSLTNKRTFSPSSCFLLIRHAAHVRMMQPNTSFYVSIIAHHTISRKHLVILFIHYFSIYWSYPSTDRILILILHTPAIRPSSRSSIFRDEHMNCSWCQTRESIVCYTHSNLIAPHSPSRPVNRSHFAFFLILFKSKKIFHFFQKNY